MGQSVFQYNQHQPMGIKTKSIGTSQYFYKILQGPVSSSQKQICRFLKKNLLEPCQQNPVSDKFFITVHDPLELIHGHSLTPSFGVPMFLL